MYHGDHIVLHRRALGLCLVVVVVLVVTISHICQCVCHSGGAAHTPKTIMAKNPLQCTVYSVLLNVSTVIMYFLMF